MLHYVPLNYLIISFSDELISFKQTLTRNGKLFYRLTDNLSMVSSESFSRSSFDVKIENYAVVVRELYCLKAVINLC